MPARRGPSASDITVGSRCRHRIRAAMILPAARPQPPHSTQSRWKKPMRQQGSRQKPKRRNRTETLRWQQTMRAGMTGLLQGRRSAPPDPTRRPITAARQEPGVATMHLPGRTCLTSARSSPNSATAAAGRKNRQVRVQRLFPDSFAGNQQWVSLAIALDSRLKALDFTGNEAERSDGDKLDGKQLAGF